MLYWHKDRDPHDLIFPLLKPGKDYTDKVILHNAISSATTLANKSMKKIEQLIEAEKKIRFHTSRHTYATRALRKGMRIEYVSKSMGHSDIKTTQIYSKIVDEELDKAMGLLDD